MPSLCHVRRSFPDNLFGKKVGHERDFFSIVGRWTEPENLYSMPLADSGNFTGVASAHCTSRDIGLSHPLLVP